MRRRICFIEKRIDVIDELTGEKTGEVISKNQAHEEGIWHSSVHLLIVSKDHKKTLLQKRCANKRLYPNTKKEKVEKLFLFFIRNRVVHFLDNCYG